MIDREKVIKALECCLRNDHKKCPYYSADILDTTCYTRLHTDAITLLKEQEAKHGEWIDIWREDDPDTSSHARCSVCNMVSARPVGAYCKWCGAKMDSEGR